MSITDFFIRRKVTTTLLMAAILVFGVLSYLGLPVSDLPTVEYPTIQVQASLPGANPDTMASSVATPLEKNSRPSPESIACRRRAALAAPTSHCSSI